MCFQMSPKLSVAEHLNVDGKVFHRRGPAAAELLSPKLVCVRGTVFCEKMNGDEDDNAWR